MLTPDQIERLGNSVQVLIDPITDYLTKEIARRVSEAGQLTSTASYQVWKLQTLGKSQTKIKKTLEKMLKLSSNDIEKLLAQSAEIGYNYDASRLPSDAIPFAENPQLQSIVQFAIEETRNTLNNITGTMGFILPDGTAEPLTSAYTKASDFAFTKAATGAEGWQKAVQDAVRQLANRGIVHVDYESGRKVELGAAVRLNVMSSIGKMQARIEQYVHDDLGADGWEISAHFASAPDHEPIQGKQYTDAEYQALNASLVRQIGTLHCGHSAHPIILGVSQPQYTPSELAKMREENEKGITYEGKHYTTYEATQRQRTIERLIRENERTVKVYRSAGLDTSKYRTKLVRLNDEYRRFSKAAGLVEQRERLWIA